MRRHRQQLTKEESIAILLKMTSGTLALAGDNDYPYAVPISYVYHNNKIYFHSALQGHKIDALARNPRVSFCVIEQDQVIPEEFTTYYKSVILFGKARILTDPSEKHSALEILARKYSPNNPTALLAEIQKGLPRLLMLEISIDHLSGKQSIELLPSQNNKETPNV